MENKVSHDLSPKDQMEYSCANHQTSMEKSVREFSRTISSGSILDENEEDCLRWRSFSYEANYSPLPVSLSNNNPYSSSQLVFDEKECSQPQTTIDETDPGNSFWNALTPPQFYSIQAKLVRNSLKSRKDKNGYSLNSSYSSQPEGSIRHSYKKKTQVRKTKSLTIITNTLRIVTENSKWAYKKHFKSSVKVYCYRILKELLNNAIIRQTMVFKAHTTLRNLRMQQKLIYRSRVIEQWLFEKGYVHSKVITVWETIMQRIRNLNFFKNPTLTGHATMETEFYDGNRLLYKYKTCIIFK